MEVAYHHMVLFFLVTFALQFLIDAAATTSKKPIVFRLIHRYSSNSPYYDPDATVYDHADQLIASSNARYDYIAARTKRLTSASDDIRAPVIADYADYSSGTFLVSFSIGEPPVRQLAIMDTGSGLLWIQCLPCPKCIQRQINPIFDPEKSSTYTNLPCDYCYAFEFFSYCIKNKTECIYVISYADKDHSVGTMAREKLTFDGDGDLTKSNVLFGCGHSNKMQRGLWNGIMGLNADNSSLVSQTGSKFSYCIGKIRDISYAYNVLMIGDGAFFDGYQTHFEIHENQYYLSLKAISVDEIPLSINPTVFQRNSYGEGGVIMDSGVFLNYLPRQALDQLKTRVEDLMANVLQKVVYAKQPNLLCFQGDASRDTKGFPLVTLHFDGADLELDTDSLFTQMEKDIFCMAFTLAKDGPAVIGILAQQNYNIAYDLITKKLSFLRMDCEIIDGEL